MGLVRVGRNVLRFRGGVNQWAWIVHRIAGVGVFLFLALHVVDICMATLGPAAFDRLLFLYKGFPARLLEMLLMFGLLYHALNGTRLAVAGFFPPLATLRRARAASIIVLVSFAALYLPAGFAMMWMLPLEPFHHHPLSAAAVTLAFPLVPAGLVAAYRRLSPARMPAIGVDGDYEGALAQAAAPESPRRRGRELGIWLFVRVSALLLLALALFHFSWLHFVVRVENITFLTIVSRWNDPANPGQSLLWRVYDIALLATALTHGSLGVSAVLRDYVPGDRARRIVRTAMGVLWAALVTLGAAFVLLFRGGSPV